jgi:hypothetical protein
MCVSANKQRLSPNRITLPVFWRVRKIAKFAFVMSAHMSVRMGQLGSQWTDFHENLYLCIFRKLVEKIQVSLKSDKNNEYFT